MGAELGPDELWLRGRLQVQIARDALATTDKNREAQNTLDYLLMEHDSVVGKCHRDGQPRLDILLMGEEAQILKTDIIASLKEVASKRTFGGEGREAARCLLEILQEQDVE